MSDNLINTELLISTIFERPALWDKRLKTHCNRNILAKQWGEISTILKIEDAKLRKKWKYLRDQFSIELGKIRPQKSGDDYDESKYYPSWPHFKQLLFLKDVVRPRQGSGNLTLTVGDIEATQEGGNQCSENNFQNSQIPAETHDFETAVSDHNAEVESGDASSSTNSVIRQPSSKKTVSLSQSMLEIEKRKLELYADNLKRKRINEQEDDEDLYFLKSLTPHIKKIPDRLKLSFRSAVHDLIQRYAYPSEITTPMASTPHSDDTSITDLDAQNNPIFLQHSNNLLSQAIICSQIGEHE